MDTNNLDISLTSISDDKILNKYTSISDLFSTSSNLPILDEPVTLFFDKYQYLDLYCMSDLQD